MSSAVISIIPTTQSRPLLPPPPPPTQVSSTHNSNKPVNQHFPITQNENDDHHRDDRSWKTKPAIFLTFCAVLLFAITSLIATFSVLTLTRIDEAFDDVFSVAVFLEILVFSLIAITSLGGVYYLFPRRSSPKIIVLTVLSAAFGSLLIISLAVAVFGLYFLFAPSVSSDDTWICMPGHLERVQDAFLTFVCDRSPVLKGLSFTFLICSWSLEFALAFICNRYARRMKDLLHANSGLPLESQLASKPI